MRDQSIKNDKDYQDFNYEDKDQLDKDYEDFNYEDKDGLNKAIIY